MLEYTEFLEDYFRETMLTKTIAYIKKNLRWGASFALALVGALAFGYVALQPARASSHVSEPISGPISGPIEPTPTPTPSPSPTPTPSPSPTPVPVLTVEGFKRAFGSVRGAPNYDPIYDANNDGRISVVDYSALLTRFAFSGYYLERQPSPDIIMNPGANYSIQALLRDAQGNVVTYQQGLSYSWSIYSPQGGPAVANIAPFSACTEGIQPPCPEDHLGIQGLNPGYAFITASVLRNSDQTTLTEGNFFLNVTSEPLVYFNNLSPNGGETFTVGQNITVSWNVVQGTYDYANIYYQYYANGRLWARFLGAAPYGTNQLNWVIPPEEAGRRARISIDPIRNGIVVGQGISDSYFTVSPQSATVAQSCTFEDLKKAFFARRGDPRYNSTCDLNKDGVINIRDYSLLLRRLRG